MVCFVNVESVDRIIYSIFQRFNLEWKTRTLNLFTQAADGTYIVFFLTRPSCRSIIWQLRLSEESCHRSERNTP
jgi:hypothetical protein